MVLVVCFGFVGCGLDYYFVGCLFVCWCGLLMIWFCFYYRVGWLDVLFGLVSLMSVVVLWFGGIVLFGCFSGVMFLIVCFVLLFGVCLFVWGCGLIGGWVVLVGFI